MSEAGQVGTNDIRNRHGRIVEIVLSSAGFWKRAVPIDTEPSISLNPRDEAFSVAWCPFGSTTSLNVAFEGIDHCFHLSESTASLTGFETIYGITSAIISRNSGLNEPANVWYSGNGIFGISEELETGDILNMTLLTANTAQLVFGRRGLIESWTVF
jgi:hypothetical protein